MNDAIPICRSVEKHWVFEDAEYFKLWYCILSNTQYTVPARKKVYQGIMYTQHRGEFLFGRREWSRRYGVSEQRIRKFMDLLVADGMVVRTQLTRKFSIYRVVNYDKFNPLKKPVDADVVPPTEPTETPQTTHEKPTDNPQTTTIKKDKKDKNDKEDTYDYFADFWSKYPKKKAKGDAEKAWKKIKPTEYDALFAGLEAQKKSNDWLKDGGKFIPYPASWLNGRRWEDSEVIEIEDKTDPNSEYQKKLRRELEESRRVTW